MACSAYISYQLDNSPLAKSGTSTTTTTIRVPGRSRPKQEPRGTDSDVTTLSQTSSTAFVLVDPSAPKSSGNNGGDAARKNIRKHASKACAARRLATIAAKKKSKNVLTKREKQKQLAAERLEAALQQHAHKLASSTFVTVSQVQLARSASAGDTKTIKCLRESSAVRQLPTPDSNASPRRGSDDSVSSVTATAPADDVNQVVDVAASASNDFADNVAFSSWIDEPSKPSCMALSPVNHQIPPDITPAYLGVTPEVQTRRLDPFSTFPVDVEDDGKLRFFFGFLDQHIFSLMDLRLPMKFDKAMGTRHSHSRELPHFVLSSEPLFWTMALSAATILALQNRLRPGAEPITMGYRYMAIRTVNQRLNSLGENSIYDVGLIYAIASLGVWEREKGSKEVWHSHCQGIEMLSQRLRRASQHHILSYIVGCCHTAGSIPIHYEIGQGFQRMGDDANSLEPTLISGIYECGQVDSSPVDSPIRSTTLATAATKLLTFRISDMVPKSLCGSKNRTLDGDRRNLEIHVLLQGAGASMIRALKREEDVIEHVDMIDFDETCVEAVALANSISVDSAYNELLLWAVVTIFALNGYASPEALTVVDMLAVRLRMVEWAQVEASLRLFVFVGSRVSVYRDFWTKLQQWRKERRRSS